jgi:hypothetical protein
MIVLPFKIQYIYNLQNESNSLFKYFLNDVILNDEINYPKNTWINFTTYRYQDEKGKTTIIQTFLLASIGAIIYIFKTRLSKIKTDVHIKDTFTKKKDVKFCLILRSKAPLT